MSFFAKLVGTVRAFFRPRTADEAMEKKELFAKIYLITGLVGFTYFTYRVGQVKQQPQPQRTRLFPDSWYEFLEKFHIKYETLAEVEKRHREFKLKQLQEEMKNELDSSNELVNPSNT